MIILDGFDGKNCEKVVKEKCLNPHCSEHIGKCREECNTHACDWDGKICSLGVLPWQNCSAHKCWQKFGNGKCDPECNTDVCSFDGHDCGNLHKSNCSDDVYCKKVFGDGICNTVCNTPECGFDGNDCEDKPKHKYVSKSIAIHSFDVQHQHMFGRCTFRVVLSGSDSNWNDARRILGR